MAGRNVIICGDELYHHGIKGQKWGVRRFQNSDGTLTEEGQKRYGGAGQREHKGLTDKQKTALVVGATAAATALALYGAYKISEKNASHLFRQYKDAMNYGEAFLHDFIRNDGVKDPGVFANYERSTFTNGNIKAKVQNPWYNNAVNARDKLNKNIYNLMTQKYDQFIKQSIPDSATYIKDVDASDASKYGRGNVSYERDYAENFGTMSKIVDRVGKRNKKL